MFYEVVFGSGILGVLIWLALFIISTVALAIGLKLMLSLRAKNFVNHEVSGMIASADESLTLHDMLAKTDEKSSKLFDRTVHAVIKKFHEPHEAKEEAALNVMDKHSRNILRNINALQMCSNIAPMLGLLGTVQGMVCAFIGLGSAMGPEKASAIAIAIAQALYTTAAGLVIAIPAIAACVFFRNCLEKHLEHVNDDVNHVLSCLKRS